MLSATGHAMSGGTNGVVMEDGSNPTLTLTSATNVVIFTMPTNHPTYGEWNSRGRPLCWCYNRQCRGDTNNAYEAAGKFWVYTTDLNLLLASWKKAISAMTNPAWICADFNHNYEAAGKFRVYTTDLNLLLANWKKNNTAPDCYDTY